ncbi:MAG: serine/threonine-protein kinase [Bacillota bacterium]
MRGFRYKHGDRPLEGYTIQRAAGRGGFGEVYYAVSDSGREVALKVVQGYEQIELRGVSQCMNLKSPHLVTIFDVKHNEEGVPFVIMEFVSGPSLRQLLDECPQGLGAQKAAFFLREIGKGLQYLHDCGIVHRDLKPGNIFYENGYVKIGDYGLSKAISTSQHSEQTVTVGTVHYMAPEISMGKYDKAIDIYALGAMLFEMLTGQVPYLGGSPGEILMKHMTAEPNLAGIEEPFATVIKKAMHRDPEQRYQSVQEMVEAVFGSEQVQQSVSCFSPDSLTIVAERVANRVAVGGGSATPPPLPKNRAAVAEAGDVAGDWANRFGRNMEQFGDRMEQWGERFGRHMADLGARLGGAQPGQRTGTGEASPAGGDARRDPLTKKQRSLLTLSVMVILAGAMGVFHPSFARQGDIFPVILLSFIAIGGAATGILLAVRRLGPQLVHESRTTRRFAIGGLACAGMLLLSMPMFLTAPGNVQSHLSHMVIPLLLALFLTDWIQCTLPGRAERVSFKHVVRIAAVGFVLSLVCEASPELAIGVLAGVSLVVQIKSPWDPMAAREVKVATGQGLAAGLAMGMPDTPQMGGAAIGAVLPPPLPGMRPAPGIARRPVATWARILWLVFFPRTLSMGLMLVITAGVTNSFHDTDFALAVGFGVGLIGLALICLRKAVQYTFPGCWSYLVNPLLMWALAQTILISACVLGNTHPNAEETAFGIFFIVFPAVMLITVAFIRGRRTRAAETMSAAAVAPAAPVPSMSMAGGEAVGVAAMPPVVSPGVVATLLPATMPSGISVAVVLTHSRNFVLASVGWVLLLAAFVLGLGVAVDLPGMIAAGIVDPRLAEDLSREAQKMQVEDWQRLMRTLLVVFVGVGMFLAMVFFMMARRTAGAGHMIRSIMGVSSVVIALVLLYAGLAGHWVAVPVGQGPGMPPAPVDVMGPMVPHAPMMAHGPVSVPASVDAFFNQAQGVPVFFAAVVMILAMVFLLWPAGRNPVAVRR